MASAENLSRGAYILAQSKGEPEVILIASGSEVSLALEALNALQSEEINARIVSFPSWELFEQQNARYQESVLPQESRFRLAVEAGVSQGWHRWVGDQGYILAIDKFGASAPYEKIYTEYGLTAENITKHALILLGIAA
jgi:transketolase